MLNSPETREESSRVNREGEISTEISVICNNSKMKKGQRKGGGKNKKRRANKKSAGGNNSRPKLRFQVGDSVECCLDDGWIKGTVIRLWYEPNLPGVIAVAPYQVLLESGSIVFAPVDDDLCIRLCTKPQIKIHLPKEGTPLRFDVGDRVEVMTNFVYMPGTIVGLWPKSDFWEEGGTVPYAVRLDNGMLTFTICDVDVQIKLYRTFLPFLLQAL